MRKLDIGIHNIPARPLLLDSSFCLVSPTVAVSRLGTFPPLTLEQDVLDCMANTPAGTVDMVAVPPEAKAMEQRLAQHVARTYQLGDGQSLNDDEYQSQVLWCQGASFHEDAVFDCVLAVMLWHGECRDLVLPHLDVVVPMEPGMVVLLDSAQPHGLLLPGHRTFDASHYQDACARSIFCTLDLPRDLPGLQKLMAYEQGPRHLPRYTFRIADNMGVDETNGRWVPARFKMHQSTQSA